MILSNVFITWRKSGKSEEEEGEYDGENKREGGREGGRVNLFIYGGERKREQETQKIIFIIESQTAMSTT